MIKFFVLLAILIQNTFACIPGANIGFSFSGKSLSPSERLNQLNKEDIDKIIHRVHSAYKDTVRSLGAELEINNNWNSLEISASTDRVQNKYIINLEGGISKHHLMNSDSIAMILCHELGHHIGGAPKYPPIISTWASTEGQSDYFGSSKCFKKVFISDDNVDLIRNLNIPKVVQMKCEDSYINHNDVSLCIRSAISSKRVVELLKSLRSATDEISFNTPDLSVVEETNIAHPLPQCRLDTYLSGSLCNIDFNLSFDALDPRIGACNRIDGYNIESRPLCWFKPLGVL